MSGVMGIDVAWARPTVPQILATGAHFVARYFSTDAAKDLTAAEVIAYPAAGLSIVTVWETTTGRATQGYQAGADDARAAEAKRRSVGLPLAHIHHFAVDEDTTWGAVQPYFQGVASVIGLPRCGLYGGFKVIEGAAAFGITYLWQTTAWSAGQWSSHATIRQTGATTLSGQADINNTEAADYGQYPRPETDMPLTPADTNAVANAVVNALTSTGPRDTLAAANVYWMRRAMDPTVPLPTGANLPPVVAETAALRAALVAQQSAMAGAFAALIKALGTGGGTLTSEQAVAAAQTGAAAALAQLGHTLDGTKA